MPPGPDADDEELVDIDVEIEGPPPLPRPASAAAEAVPEALGEPEPTERSQVGAPAPAPDEPFEITDVIELRPPSVEAAEDDRAAELVRLEAEANAADGGRRAALLLEIARLRDQGGADGAAAAIAAARAAFDLEAGSATALAALHRLLARAGRWEELADVLDRAARARAVGADPRGRADLIVERGRLLEDRLDRVSEAVDSYRQALVFAPEHTGALLSLLLAGVRQRAATLRAEALGGLARHAAAPALRAALAIEEALDWRRSPMPDGASRALDALEAALAKADPGLPVGTLLTELDGLTRAEVPAEVAARAVAALAERIAPADPVLAVALLRERARLLARPLGAPEAALDALAEAARLEPGHPLVAADRLALTLALDRPAAAAQVAQEFVTAAARDDEAADVALAAVEALFDPADPEAAVEILRTPRVQAGRPARADLRALELALAARRRDLPALADAFAFEAESAADADGGSRIDAWIAAGAIRAALGQSEEAVELYRRALGDAPAAPRARPALQALVALEAARGRGAEAAAILEAAVASEAPAGADGRAALENWARAVLVALYADELAVPGRALPHQRRLVALRPQDVPRRVRLADLDLEAPDGERLAPRDRADNLLALATAAGDPAVAVALKVAAGRALAEARAPDERARGAALLGEVAPADPSGLAAAARERLAATPAARAELVAGELGDVEPASVERTRALRFRLAHHRATDGKFAEALAALTPLRSEGDPLARAWSYELARRSGEAILEVAVLSHETRVPDGALGDEGTVRLAHGEALARAGDPQGAAESFQRVLARDPDGEEAPDAALGLFRLASAEPAGGAAGLPEALEALAGAITDDPALAAALGREAALAAMAGGHAVPIGREEEIDAAVDPAARADLLLLRFMAGARAQDGRVVAESLVRFATGMADSNAASSAEATGLLGRAAARARLAGADAADAVAGAVWRAGRPAALAPALTDLPVVGAAPWPASRPDPRRSRARRTGGALGVALHLEAALDAERSGQLGTALAAYGSVIALDPERLEAWIGVRRVARAGGDRLGEARALARLGALCRDPGRAAALLVEAGDLYEQAGRVDDAITVLSHATEIRPDDPVAVPRAHALLRADPTAPGRASLLDGFLSYRLAAATLSPDERVALLFERAEHRRTALGDRTAAERDFKLILKIVPDHSAALDKLAQDALAAGDSAAAARWLERYLESPGTGDPTRAAAARLELAACYAGRGEPVRAIETLRAAAAASPADPTPLERMSEIHLRRGDAPRAVEALAAAAARLPAARAQAALSLRIGEIWRDTGRDPARAAAAFRQAADLDPLGPAAAALVALYDAASNPRGALEVVEREIADLRRVLADAPLDPRRLERLASWLADARRRGGSGAWAEADAAVESVRALAENRLPPEPATVPPAPKVGRALIAAAADPPAAGFAAEIWPHLVEAAEAAFPPPPARPRAAPLSADEAARTAWIGALAAAMGIPRLALAATHDAGAPPAIAVAGRDPAMIVAVDAPAGAALRFHVGRALALIAEQALVLERTSAKQLAPLFSSAALLAGAAVPPGLPEPDEIFLRDVGRTVGRKDRKALTLQTSRFGFEHFDLEAWRAAMLAAADRFGLLVAGDPARAALALAGDAGAIARHPAARALLGFALGERYPALQRSAAGKP